MWDRSDHDNRTFFLKSAKLGIVHNLEPIKHLQTTELYNDGLNLPDVGDGDGVVTVESQQTIRNKKK